jgi:hypothetical protein
LQCFGLPFFSSTFAIFVFRFCLKKYLHSQCFVFHFVWRKIHTRNVLSFILFWRKIPRYLTCLVSHFFQRKTHTHNTTILNSKRIITVFLTMYILFLFPCLKCLLWRTEVA